MEGNPEHVLPLATQADSGTKHAAGFQDFRISLFITWGAEEGARASWLSFRGRSRKQQGLDIPVIN